MAKRAKKAHERRDYGSGSVYPNKNGTFTAQYRLNDGRLRRETYATREAAEARLDEIARLKQGEYEIAAGLQTVHEWLDTWLDLRRRSGKALRTIEGYMQIIEGYILPRVGALLLADVRATHLQALVNYVEDDIAARSDGRYSGTRTVHLVATVLWQAFDLAVKRRLIPFHPMDGVLLPEHHTAKVNPADELQLLAVLTHAHQSPHPALWYSYALLGLRRGEPLGWRWADLDLNRATVHVRQQVQATEDGLHLLEPKRTSIRLLPLPAIIVPLLRQRQTEQRRERMKAGSAWQDHDLVFCGPDGRPFWPTTINHWWYELRERASLPATLKLHHLRHTFTTLLEEAGATEAIKRSVIGHGDKTVTQRYTHARIAAMRKVVEEVVKRVLAAGEDEQGQEA